MLWDVFISHASEDKASVARPLAQQLEASGLRVWFDETQLKVGDSLRAKIDEGLAQSRFGVVVLSPAFFSKRWPQRELAGLVARDVIENRVILPVWHNISAVEVAAVSPTLADTVAASTTNGISKVAEQILEAAAPYLRPTQRQYPRPYSTQIEFPVEAIRRALDVLESLTMPATWRQLEHSAPGYPNSGWMGSDSATIIEVLYGFAAPLYVARAVSYAARRSQSLLDRSSRLRLAFLDAALEVFLNEGAIASTSPPIPYSPRVPNWRRKRVEDPARYWWQGITPDRFDEARPFLLRSSPSAIDSIALVPINEFRDSYRALFRSGLSNERQQQTLGLLGNAFYGFTPRTRPVLWRMIMCQARLYQAALGNTEFDPEKDSARDAERIFTPREPSMFPFTVASVPDDVLYEPLNITASAATTYLTTFVVPRLVAAMLASQES